MYSRTAAFCRCDRDPIWAPVDQAQPQMDITQANPAASAACAMLCFWFGCLQHIVQCLQFLRGNADTIIHACKADHLIRAHPAGKRQFSAATVWLESM